MTNIWNKYFFRQSPIFTPIVPAYQKMHTTDDCWPILEDFNQLIADINGKLLNRNQQAIQFIPQSETCETFEQQYEPLIYLEGTVQTRLASWHDFFQVLVWSTFPRLKSSINALHYEAALARQKKDPNNKQRSTIENFLTLFDECGAILIVSDESLEEQIRNFHWHTLFIEHRDDFSQKIECIVFGHAMYEKAIQPYIGMTAHCLFLHQPESFFQLPQWQKNQIIDEQLSQLLMANKNWSSKSLQPFPILGVPGWHPENYNPAFYENENYFRKKRQK